MTMRTTNEAAPKDRIYPGAQPDRWIDARQPLPQPVTTPQVDGEQPKPVVIAAQPCGCLEYRLAHDCGIPISGARLIVAELKRLSNRIEALERFTGYAPAGAERRDH